MTVGYVHPHVPNPVFGGDVRISFFLLARKTRMPCSDKVARTLTFAIGLHQTHRNFAKE